MCLRGRRGNEWGLCDVVLSVLSKWNSVFRRVVGRL
jgi:hypothetical protein